MFKLPELNEEDYVQICFVHRYTKIKEDVKTQAYSFYKKTIHKDISNQIKKWLIGHFNKIKEKSIVDYNPANVQETFEKINLKDFEDWSDFRERGFSGLNLGEINLKTIKNNLVAFMIFIKKNGVTYGYLRKLTKGSILDSSGAYTLFFDKGSFNQLKEEKGIRIDKYSDLIFSIKEGQEEGIIFNKEHFKSIFYLHEEDKLKSIENAKKVNIFKNSRYSEDFYDVVRGDGMIQRMLRNPAFEDYINDIGYKELKGLKKAVPEINFELDEKQKDFILPEGREKDAIRDLIKAITGRFSITLDKKKVVETQGVNKVYTSKK